MRLQIITNSRGFLLQLKIGLLQQSCIKLEFVINLPK